MVKSRQQDRQKTGKQVRSTSKEDAKAENASEEGKNEEVIQQPAWLLISVGMVIVAIGAIWLLAPSI